MSTSTLQSIIFTVSMIFTTTLYGSLPFYKEINSFKIFCLPTEYKAADELSTQLTICLNQTLDYLNHSLIHNSIIVMIHPNLNTLHSAIGNINAADWVIGQIKNHTIDTVSPYNPGPIHSYNSVMKGNNVNLVTLLIMDKYSHHASIPRWLHQGLALYLAHYFSENSINTLKNSTYPLPTLLQLEAISKEDNITFANINGFIIAYSLIKFIDTQWNKNTLLKLLENYDHFEEILNISKEDFTNCWHKFLYEKE